MNEVVENFLYYMTVERGASPNTLAAYRNDLAQLVEHLQLANGHSNGYIGWNEVSEQTISEYVLYLHGLGYSETTKARKIASTRSLFGVSRGSRARWKPNPTLQREFSKDRQISARSAYRRRG